MYRALIQSIAAISRLAAAARATRAEVVTLRSVLAELASPDAVASYPEPAHRCLQASSYNRESTQTSASAVSTGTPSDTISA